MLKGLTTCAVGVAALLGLAVTGAEATAIGAGLSKVGALESGRGDIVEIQAVVQPKPRYYGPWKPFQRRMQGPDYWYSGGLFVAPAYYGAIVPGRCEHQRTFFFQRKRCEGTYMPIR